MEIFIDNLLHNDNNFARILFSEMFVFFKFLEI